MPPSSAAMSPESDGPGVDEATDGEGTPWHPSPERMGRGHAQPSPVDGERPA